MNMSIGKIIYKVSTALLALAAFSLPSRAAETVKIGAIYPLTGQLASYGQGAQKALQCAASLVNDLHKEVNHPLAQQGGLKNLPGKPKIELVFADAPDPQGAVAAAQRLISQDKVVALTGSFASSITEPASRIAEQHKIPFVNGDSSASNLTERGFKYFFRTTPLEADITAEAVRMAKEFAKSTGADTFTAAVVHEDSQFGQSSANGLKAALDKVGASAVTEVSYRAQAADLTGVALKLRTANPDVVFLSSYVPDAVLLTKTLKQMNFFPKALIGLNGTNVPAYLSGLGTDAEDVMGISLFPADLGEEKPVTGQINAFCKQLTGQALDDSSSRALVGFLVLVDAINRAGTSDSEAVRGALAATDLKAQDIIMPWRGVKFNATTQQNELGSVAFQQIQGGAFQTIWPPELAVSKPVWPAPAWNAR
jgi:branched-chain amino acid transport system substrate-binding protein